MGRVRSLALLPGTVGISEQRARAYALGFLGVAASLGVAGGTWDAAWHVTLRRETFWSPPHLLLYSGTTIALFSSLAGLLSPWAQRRPLLRTEPGFLIAAVGALVVIGAAPVDDFWHRTFGRDVDVWSFPHLVALVGGCGINVGAALASRQGRETGRSPPQLARLEVLFLTALLWVVMFGLNWYTLVLARVRDSLEYPLLAIAVAVPVLAASLLGRGGATLIAAAYLLYTATAHQFLAIAGFALLPFPPVVIAGAVAVDVVMGTARLAAPWRGIAAGALFGPLFILAEAASLAWYPHPMLPPPASELTLGYYNAARERPWDVEHLALTLPLGLAVGAGVGFLSVRLTGGLLRIEREARAHSGEVTARGGASAS